MKHNNNHLSTRFGALILSLLINAIGNEFTIVSNCGSGIWTAAAVNISPIFHWSIGLVIFGYAVIAVIVNQILIAHFDLKRTLGELIYSLLFGYFINFFTIIINDLGFGRLNLFMRTIEACFGIVLVCGAISLYQRANICR